MRNIHSIEARYPAKHPVKRIVLKHQHNNVIDLHTLSQAHGCHILIVFGGRQTETRSRRSSFPKTLYHASPARYSSCACGFAFCRHDRQGAHSALGDDLEGGQDDSYDYEAEEQAALVGDGVDDRVFVELAAGGVEPET